jgi:hypothetical protein
MPGLLRFNHGCPEELHLDMPLAVERYRKPEFAAGSDRTTS